MSSGGGGQSSSNTVTQTQQIPEFEQQFALENQDLARSLASQPYPVYNAPLVQDFTPTQRAGQDMAIQAANSYQPGLAAANQATAAALQPNGAVTAGANAIGNSLNANPYVGAGGAAIGNALYNGSPANPGVIQQYMSPFVQAALAPQITALNEQIGQQQRGIDARATQANAFGDARQGAAEALNNFYGNQSLSGLLANGYNTAYTNALQTATQQQQLGLQGGQALANIGANQQQLGMQGGQALANIGANQQSLGLQGGAQLGNLAGLQQQLGLQGANAVYAVGQQQQQLGQQELNTAYQQYQNQVQWPYQMENIRLSALSNSPYNITSQTTLPQANMTASNLGTFASLAGLLGGAANGNQAPFGGTSFPSGRA